MIPDNSTWTTFDILTGAPNHLESVDVYVNSHIRIGGLYIA